MGREAQVSESPAWPWPDSLDAVIAAPRHHKLMFENERVRILEVRIPPGETVPVHTHRWPSAIYVAKQSDFIAAMATATCFSIVAPLVRPRPRRSYNGCRRFLRTRSRM